MNAIAKISHLEKIIDYFEIGPIDLTIEPGTITALIGNNGSGKSTFLKMLMNLAKPYRGNIQLFGKWVNGPDESWKQRVAYLPQKQIGFEPFKGETLKEMISGLYPNWDESLFQKIIADFKVPLHKKYNALSPGLQQKLNLALTIPRNTELMILDEPTNFMDIPSKSLLQDILAEWMEHGDRALLFASHQAEDIQKLADYLVLLKDGVQKGVYLKEDLLENYQTYWFGHALTDTHEIPGILTQEGNQLISDCPPETEKALEAKQIKWHSRSALPLEDIIALLLS